MIEGFLGLAALVMFGLIFAVLLFLRKTHGRSFEVELLLWGTVVGIATEVITGAVESALDDKISVLSSISHFVVASTGLAFPAALWAFAGKELNKSFLAFIIGLMAVLFIGCGLLSDPGTKTEILLYVLVGLQMLAVAGITLTIAMTGEAKGSLTLIVTSLLAALVQIYPVVLMIQENRIFGDESSKLIEDFSYMMVMLAIYLGQYIGFAFLVMARTQTQKQDAEAATTALAESYRDLSDKYQELLHREASAPTTSDPAY